MPPVEKKHSKGPWHVGTNSSNLIFADNGRMRMEHSGTTLFSICKMTSFDAEEDEANAALVAKAPEMDAALELLWKHQDVIRKALSGTCDAAAIQALRALQPALDLAKMLNDPFREFFIVNEWESHPNYEPYYRLSFGDHMQGSGEFIMGSCNIEELVLAAPAEARVFFRGRPDSPDGPPVMREIKPPGEWNQPQSLAQLATLWEDLRTMEMDVDGELNETPWQHFPAGTHYKTIHEWFESQNPLFCTDRAIQGHYKELVVDDAEQGMAPR